ncbi:MAG: flagellar FliJ family protein [Proteobacteria bacterium]|nr:flagellar FliJ family protein [Pseudomonadota bacterium]
MKSSLIARLLRITDKQINELLSKSNKLKGQITNLQGALKGLYDEQQREQRFFVETAMNSAVDSGDKAVHGTTIYNAAPYIKHMEHRQEQVKLSLSECQKILAMVQAQLMAEYQKQQQYQKLLEHQKAQEKLEANKREQAEMDEQVAAKLKG